MFFERVPFVVAAFLAAFSIRMHHENCAGQGQPVNKTGVADELQRKNPVQVSH
jgi:hypothetical protein